MHYSDRPVTRCQGFSPNCSVSLTSLKSYTWIETVSEKLDPSLTPGWSIKVCRESSPGPVHVKMGNKKEETKKKADLVKPMMIAMEQKPLPITMLPKPLPLTMTKEREVSFYIFGPKENYLILTGF